jgi:hypothetical protein
MLTSENLAWFEIPTEVAVNASVFWNTKAHNPFSPDLTALYPTRQRNFSAVTELENGRAQG